MSHFPFKMSRDLWHSLKIGDTLVSAKHNLAFKISDIDYRRGILNRREVHKIYSSTGLELTYFGSGCVAAYGSGLIVDRNEI